MSLPPLPDITVPNGASRFNVPAGAGFVQWFAALRASINVALVEAANRATSAAVLEVLPRIKEGAVETLRQSLSLPLVANEYVNPSAEGAANLSPDLNCAVTISSDALSGWPMRGAKSFKVANNGAAGYRARLAHEHRAIAAPGQVWAAGATLYNPMSTARTFRIEVAFHDTVGASGANAIATNLGTSVTIGPRQSARLFATGSGAPTGTKTVSILFTSTGAGGAVTGDSFYVDEIDLYQGSTARDFFFGGLPTAAWAGGENNSRSIGVTPTSIPEVDLGAIERSTQATVAAATDGVYVVLRERRAPSDATSTPLTVFSGTPAYSAGKFGNAIKGATLLLPAGMTDQTGYYTVDYWQHLAVAPGFNKVLLDVPGYYLGLGAAGQLYNTDPNAVTGPNVCDGVWHHIAFSMYRTAGAEVRFEGVWVDGVRVIAPGSTKGQAAWYQFSLGGFHAAAGSEARNVAFDDLRVSFGASPRYTGTFTPPTSAAAADTSTLLLAPLSSLDASKPGPPGEWSYPPRPSDGRIPWWHGLDDPPAKRTGDRMTKVRI